MKLLSETYIPLELLHFEITTPHDLRRACLKRENFIETVRGSQRFQTRQFTVPRRQLAEIGHDEMEEASSVEEGAIGVSVGTEMSSKNC